MAKREIMGFTKAIDEEGSFGNDTWCTVSWLCHIIH
jgi:hypothetical protein